MPRLSSDEARSTAFMDLSPWLKCVKNEFCKHILEALILKAIHLFIQYE